MSATAMMHGWVIYRLDYGRISLCKLNHVIPVYATEKLACQHACDTFHVIDYEVREENLYNSNGNLVYIQ